MDMAAAMDRYYESAEDERDALYRRIADLEEALDEATDAWASYLNHVPNVRSRKRLDEVRALIEKEE